MATSLVDLASIALTHIGDQAITALTEDSDRARAMNRVLISALDAKIREHSWNCFQLRATLIEVSETPAYDFAHQYQLPQDPLCLDVLETNLDTNEPWRIESFQNAAATATYRVLLTDATSVSILYLARITDPTRWDALFADAMAMELAWRVCYALTRNATLTDVLARQCQATWAKAKSRDGQESRALNSLRSTALTTVRFGGGFGGERLP